MGIAVEGRAICAFIGELFTREALLYLSRDVKAYVRVVC